MSGAAGDEDVLRNQYATLCDILDGSDETLTSFCARLYQSKIIDDTVRNSVSRRPGKGGAGVLLNHIELMIKQKPNNLETVLEVMEKEHFLKSVAKDIKREMGMEVDPRPDLSPYPSAGEKRSERKRKKKHEDAHSVKRECDVQSSESDGEIRQAASCSEDRIERKRKKKHKGSVKREFVQSSDSDGENKQMSKCELKTSPSSELQANTFTINVQNVIEALDTHPHWFTLGIQLGLPYDDLKVIQKNNPNDCVQCLHDMVAAWIKRGGATWEKLVMALRRDKDIAKAVRIEQKYINEH